MAYVKNTKGTSRPNFLDSEVGLVTKTMEIPQSMGEAEDGRSVVAAGTPFPSNDGQATGIVFTDTDVTDGAAAGSVMVAGRILKNRITIDDAAVTALSGKGFVFADAPEITR